MGIEKFIKKVCVQTAVYWGTPSPSDDGGMTFADPVEISCRWESKTKVIAGAKGREIVSVAEVLVTQDLDKEGYLYLGELSDLGSDEEDSPEIVEGAYMIQRFDKIPMIKSTTEFVRKAYL